MFMISRFLVIQLIFVCTCHFVSACHSPASDTKPMQQNLSAGSIPAQKAEKTVIRETKKAIWSGTVDEEDPLNSAPDIYDENPSNPAGIHEYQGLVFCIVEIPMDEEHSDARYYQMQAMLKEKDMLQKHYHLPSEFRLQKRILENRKDDDFIYFRYATVYRLKDIQALQGKADNT